MQTNHMDVQTATQMATLQANMDTARGDISEIKSDVKDLVRQIGGLTDAFVTKQEFTEYKSKNWYTHTLSAVAGAVLAAIAGVIFNSLLKL